MAYKVPDVILDTGDTPVNETDKSLVELNILEGWNRNGMDIQI